jgi:tetratricopeptide (TPR) repeat protein
MKKYGLLILLFFLNCGSYQKTTEFARMSNFCNSITNNGQNNIFTSSIKKVSLTSFQENSQTVKAYKQWSNQDLNEIRKGIELCISGNYEDGIIILTKYNKKNRKDLFLQAELANAVYKKYLGDYKTRVTKALPIYKDLLAKIEKESRIQDKNEDLNELIINTNFIDSYWKIATLYLDQENYSSAKIELERALSGFLSSVPPSNYSGNKVLEQMYLYYTEIEFYLKNKDSNRFYYCKTIQINPANNSVHKFILKE